jgi:hypothetical protein
MAAFDASAMIAEFSTDPSQTSLELPHMTTGQRKSTKELLEQYPELRCDSYGFGPERRLHLFKANHSELTETIQSSWANETPTSIALSGEAPKRSGSGMNPALVLPLTHENLQIRNTFIHISETLPDERVVQSMPHGMFKQCLRSEAADACKGKCMQRQSTALEACKGTFFCDTPTSAGDTPNLSESELDWERAGQSSKLGVGTLVQVDGLVKLPTYNGCSAVVQGWDDATGRYNILIASPSGLQQAKIKEENLSILSPCP